MVFFIINTFSKSRTKHDRTTAAAIATIVFLSYILLWLECDPFTGRYVNIIGLHCVYAFGIGMRPYITFSTVDSTFFRLNFRTAHTKILRPRFFAAPCRGAPCWGATFQRPATPAPRRPCPP